MWEKL